MLFVVAYHSRGRPRQRHKPSRLNRSIPLALRVPPRSHRRGESMGTPGWVHRVRRYGRACKEHLIDLVAVEVDCERCPHQDFAVVVFS